MPSLPTKVLVTMSEAIGIAIDVLDFIENNPDSTENLVHVPSIVLGWVRDSIEMHLPDEVKAKP